MAHPCLSCGSECYCHGDIDDVIVSHTPNGCTGCGCEDDEDDEWEEYEKEWREEQRAEYASTCRCGAWQFDSKGNVVHVADCCCGAE
jgi:hypothetical protein